MIGNVQFLCVSSCKMCKYVVVGDVLPSSSRVLFHTALQQLTLGKCHKEDASTTQDELKHHKKLYYPPSPKAGHRQKVAITIGSTGNQLREGIQR